MADVQEVAAAQAAVLKEMCKRDPVFWMTNYCWTINEHDQNEPIQKFPVKPYIPDMIKLFYSEPVLLVAKSRQVLMSWFFVAMCLHEAQFYGYRRTVLMSKKQDDAFALVERMRFIYERQPKWLKDACPLDKKLRDQPQGTLTFANGSKVQGFPQGADQIRGFTVSRLFADEAAFQDKFEETYFSALPAITGGGKMVAVSSANAGFFQRLGEFT